jgi:GC-rich sequence DNA-binding factor
LDLVRSAFAFEDILDRAALQRIVADGIIGAHVIPYVRLQLVDPSACAASLQAVVDALPADWLRAAPPAVAPARDIIHALKQSIARDERVGSSTIDAIAALAKSFRV